MAAAMQKQIHTNAVHAGGEHRSAGVVWIETPSLELFENGPLSGCLRLIGNSLPEVMQYLGEHGSHIIKTKSGDAIYVSPRLQKTTGRSPVREISVRKEAGKFLKNSITGMLAPSNPDAAAFHERAGAAAEVGKRLHSKRPTTTSSPMSFVVVFQLYPTHSSLEFAAPKQFTLKSIEPKIYDAFQATFGLGSVPYGENLAFTSDEENPAFDPGGAA